MKRIYKEDTPVNTILKIKKILCEAGIVTYESFLANPYPNIHSCRVQTVEAQGGFGQNGKGLTLEYSLASAHAEFMERLQNGFFVGESGLPISLLKRLKDKHGYYFSPDEKQISMSDFLSLDPKYLKDLFGESSTNDVANVVTKYYEQLKESGNQGVVAIPFYDYREKKIIYLPYNLTMMITGSNGMAAGNSTSEGVFQALCELFERKAATTIYYNRLTPPTVPRSVLKKYAKLYAIITEIENRGYTVIVKDFSLGKKLPVLGTIVLDNRHNKYRLNVGADTNFEVALSRTLTEIHQGLKDDDSFNSVLLDVPLKEHSYFMNDSEDSLMKRFDEIAKFKMDGSGVFPKSLFEKTESYSFDIDAFCEKDTYDAEVDYLLKLILSLGEHVYIRDSSFLGFPCFYVYVTELSHLGKKSLYTEASVDMNMHLLNNETVKLLSDIPALLSSRNGMSLLLTYYSYDKLGNGKDFPISDLLKLEFESDFYWSKIPLSYVLTISAFLLEKYSDAIEYLKIYLSTMGIADNAYYKNVIQYFLYLSENKNENYLNQHVDKEILTNFTKDYLVKSIDYPSCPNCEECKLAARCKTKNKLYIYDRLMEKMKTNIIDQKKFEALYNL
ncbi:MAG: YcaO-like family protein [Mediterranea sp.]|jgi:YcaO-like protein with predicted kinase domain|nr:YcaO-like family protein [Mediterranea sp.]